MTDHQIADFWVRTLGTILQAGSIAATAYFAVRGLRTWRFQMVGKRRLEVAEEVLVAFRQVVFAPQRIRSPIIHKDEQDTVNDLDDRATQNAGFKAKVMRFDKERETFLRLERVQELARYYLEPAVITGIEDLWSIIRNVGDAAQLVYLTGYPTDLDPDSRSVKEHLARMKVINYQGKNDEIDAAVNIALSKVEVACAQILRINGTP